MYFSAVLLRAKCIQGYLPDFLPTQLNRYYFRAEISVYDKIKVPGYLFCLRFAADIGRL
jgi:hypothetical protein